MDSSRRLLARIRGEERQGSTKLEQAKEGEAIAKSSEPPMVKAALAIGGFRFSCLVLYLRCSRL